MSVSLAAQSWNGKREREREREGQKTRRKDRARVIDGKHRSKKSKVKVEREKKKTDSPTLRPDKLERPVSEDDKNFFFLTKRDILSFAEERKVFVAVLKNDLVLTGSALMKFCHMVGNKKERKPKLFLSLKT